MIVNPPQDPPAAATEQAATRTNGRRGIPLPRTLVSLRYRDFRWLMLGQFTSTMGQWSDIVIRGWVAYGLGASPLVLGSITAMRSIPLLFFSLLGGFLADRFERRRQVVLAQGLNVVADFSLVALILTQRLELWHLFVTAFVSGSAHAFMMPARQALIPNLVPREDLMNAVALNGGAVSLSRALGPGAIGLVLAAWGGAAAYTAEGILHLVSGASVAMVREPPPEGPRSRAPLLRSLTGGLRYVFATPVVVLLLAISLIPMLVAQPYQALLPFFAEGILDIGASGLGLLVAAPGAGAIVGVLAMATMGDIPRKGLYVLVGTVTFGLALVAFSQSAILAVSLVALFIAGLSSAAYHPLLQHLIHVNTPDRLRGRVMSIYLLDRGLTPLGALLIGALGNLLGVPAAVLLGGSTCALLALLAAWRWPHFTKLA